MNTLQVNHDASISHDLYMERLDALTEKTLADIKAFSMRENIPYDQVCYVPLFQHKAMLKLLLLRFVVILQRDTPNIYSVTRPPRQIVNRTVRLGPLATSGVFSHPNLFTGLQFVISC
jgi:hypothetical protein